MAYMHVDAPSFVGTVSFVSLAAVLLASGLAKLVAPPSPESAHNNRTKVQAITESPAFAVGEILAGFALIAGGNRHVIALVASAAALLAVGGVIHAIVSGKPCQCFGSLTPRSVHTMMAVQGVTALSATMVLLTGSGGRALMGYANIIAVVPAVVLLLRAKRLRRGPSAPAGQNGVAFAARNLPGELVLGLATTGSSLTVREIAKEGEPLFVVGVHSKCEACKSLLPDIYALARGFAGQFPVVVIADEDHYLTTDPVAPTFFALVDRKQELARALQVDGMPYAVLVNGSGLKLMSPPAQGTGGVRLLFAIMLNARL
jgi:hypothetical protein